ncbi:hypothetical protein [Acetivibrio straminisolvens]|jgi:uncharacterized membrane protein|uniref:Uncharacterized protein n=1 Tax=Acetivibrio straminisolvens JCM 21531 TaxID=1294263 RepID=W4V516_9FIRM|nr:hypothetical protein [Acetivibrio straminisolvens]GAE88515.1 hypothetical protein JCM21531_1962 [Acetivibrio straminisolvens JCM 21531]
MIKDFLKIMCKAELALGIIWTILLAYNKNKMMVDLGYFGYYHYPVNFATIIVTLFCIIVLYAILCSLHTAIDNE